MMEKEEEFSWKNRRRMMWIVVIFCMLCISYVIHLKLDSGMAETVVTMSFVTITGVVGSFVFGATWQDVGKGK